jgi:hypothetical protein
MLQAVSSGRPMFPVCLEACRETTLLGSVPMHSDEERIPVTEFLKTIHIFYDLLSSPF